jgi:ABC-type multidrug transport system ATPase subunit
MSELAIKTERLIKSFGRKKALREINLTVKKGSFYVIFGPNGAGKTTLLKIVSSILKPDSGNVRIFGRDIVHDAGIRSQIGLVSHNTYLYENLTVLENLKFYGRLYGVKALDSKIDEVVNEFDLGDFSEKLVKTLSQGMKQRTSIARAVIQDPNILLLDEPYTGLDPSALVKFNNYLERVHSDGITSVMITHNIPLGYAMADSISFVNNGKFVFTGTKVEVSLKELEELYLKSVD